MPFRDRTEAGRRLAKRLFPYKAQNPVILALPRGGLPVAAEISRTLDAPLDLIIVRKIGVPDQPELAMGAVVDGPDPLVVRNEDVITLAGISESEFAFVRDRELQEIRRRRDRYRLSHHPDLENRIVIVVDDGVATGATTRAALRAIRRQKPHRLILAVPVAPRRSINELRSDADDIVCLEAHDRFGAIGYYYDDFTQVSDEEVAAILAQSTQSA